jgi:metal-sulfur cluster biosynthetic enzyme
MSIEETKEKIIENLREVYDPEISVNVYDLGLIYEVKVGEGYCDITMSLTSAFCPAADFIIEDVKGAAMSAGVSMVNVNVVWEPQWGPEMMSEDAKLILGIFE